MRIVHGSLIAKAAKQGCPLSPFQSLDVVRIFYNIWNTDELCRFLIQPALSIYMCRNILALANVQVCRLDLLLSVAYLHNFLLTVICLKLYSSKCMPMDKRDSVVEHIQCP